MGDKKYIQDIQQKQNFELNNQSLWILTVPQKENWWFEVSYESVAVSLDEQTLLSDEI